MDHKIIERLSKIEKYNKIHILYACDSGSHTWGVSSTSSDFDVRFIYVHPMEHYLKIDDMKNDVVESPITEGIELVGWDLRKSLRLLRKSNPTLLEWLNTDIIYYENEKFSQHMKKMSQDCFSNKATLHHYVNMASRNYKPLYENAATIKQYLNVLRPLLMCMWIYEHNKFPSTLSIPLLVDMLINEKKENKHLNKIIHELINNKQHNKKMLESIYSDDLNNFFEEQITFHKQFVQSLPKMTKPMYHTSQLDHFFRFVLNEI
ncbi:MULTISPECIES: nucleotidyltransferase domain-containing protein [Bacillaceae]|uniref:Nucleotidyltransferase domain-containing protein n=1 Tax=Evansella alkalicola TaxID=745819 RepID=A0ABS6JWK5_9BACI|nr:MULTISPECIES: nucleotidyltransferase domain-containing protein [Bacillaceae]MBU9722054.1 nucleotidyltransferase domain-containing protein [Bacillus alkalicola]